eukprot:scaffold3150_cov51-Attheya_sp.AAC.10
MALHRCCVVAALILLCNTVAVRSFSGVNIASRSRLNVQTSTCTRMSAASSDDKSLDLEQTLRGFVIASALAVTTFSGIVGMPQSALADEYGQERDAPTLFTGETVMICKKRGPLGACVATEQRTPENDNDKANSYFADPSELIKKKEANMRESVQDDGNELIMKLRKQSVENKEKNDLLVQQKTAQNDQVVIMNADGKGFALLENPQAMRLKDAGFIKDRRFVTQPTKEQLDEALESPDFGAQIKGIFGGGGGDKE